MFNDNLSDQRCTELIRQLARTRDPFHCAHGRPSMTVLCVLENDYQGLFERRPQTQQTID